MGGKAAGERRRFAPAGNRSQTLTQQRRPRRPGAAARMFRAPGHRGGWAAALCCLCKEKKGWGPGLARQAGPPKASMVLRGSQGASRGRPRGAPAAAQASGLVGADIEGGGGGGIHAAVA